jgi:hypothetical protein
MRLILYVFAFLAVVSLLFALYFVFVPIADPLREIASGPGEHGAMQTEAYFNVSLIFIVIFAISAVCLVWTAISSGRLGKV